jgi:hypothetical protein
MSTGSLQVFVDIGDQYNVIVDTSDVIVVSDDSSYFAVADFAASATTASYILLSNVDGFSNYSASVASEIATSISGSGFTPLTTFNAYTASTDILVNEKLPAATFNEYTSSFGDVVRVFSGSGANNSFVSIIGGFFTAGQLTLIRSQQFEIFTNYIELNALNFPQGGLLVGNLSGSSQESGSLIWRSDTESWYGGLFGSESRLLTQDDLDTLGIYTASVDERIESLREVTGSYATTGSNTFIGNQTITGSVSISSDGLLIFTPRERPTGSIPGALFYSSSGELYVGM